MMAISNVTGSKKQRASRCSLYGLFLLAVCGLGASMSAWAGCSVQNMTTIPLQYNVTETYSGNERPVGSTLYRATYSAGTFGQNTTVTCTTDTTLYRYLTVTSETSGAPTTMKTDFGTGPVYPTNISGIGVVYFYASPAQFISLTTPSSPAQLNVKANVPAAMGTSMASAGNFDVALVKTGPVASGSAVSISAALPHIALVVSPSQTYNASALKVVDFPQSGWITITTSSCETPDLTVQMGTYETNKFSGKGYTTDWKDASIVLSNCPKFSGYYANSATGQMIPLAGGAATDAGRTRNPNILTVTLTANNTVTNNIIGLNKDDNAATGVGIQLGYSNTINASATSPTTTWTQGTSWNISPPNDGTASFKIPLAARYYQTGSAVTPGKANASVTFTINYK